MCVMQGGKLVEEGEFAWKTKVKCRTIFKLFLAVEPFIQRKSYSTFKEKVDELKRG